MLIWLIFIISLVTAIIITNGAQQLFMRALGVSAMFFSVKKKLIAIAVIALILSSIIIQIFGIEIPNKTSSSQSGKSLSSIVTNESSDQSSSQSQPSKDREHDEINLPNTYTNEFIGIEFKYPADWIISDNSTEYGVDIYPSSETEKTTFMSVMFNQDIDYDESLFNLMTLYGDNEETISMVFGDVNDFDITKTIVNDINALRIFYTYTNDGNTIVNSSIVYDIGVDEYIITFATADNMIDKYQPLFNAIMETYTITSKIDSSVSRSSESSGILLRVTADSNLRMRKGPGTDFDIIRVIDYDEIVEKAGDGGNVSGWVNVSYKGDTGWVSSEFLAPIDPAENSAIIDDNQTPDNAVSSEYDYTTPMTEAERAYGELCVGIIKESTKLNKLFYQVVKTDDIVASITVASDLANTFEPHYLLGSPPSKRFELIYEYMDKAHVNSQAVVTQMNAAYQRADPTMLTKADEYMKAYEENIISATMEFDKFAQAQNK